MPDTVVQSIEKKAGVFLTTHHVVLYVALVIALGVGVYLIESKYAAIQEARATAAEQALAVEKDHSAQLTKQYAENEAKRQQELTQFYQTLAQIQSQNKVQIIHDKAAAAPELGHRIETITGIQQGTISLDPQQDMIIPLPLAREIVVRLDQGEADAKTVTQQQGIITNQKGTISDQAAIIVEDKKVLVATVDADKKELNAEKAKGRKWKIRLFGAGVAVGFVGRQFVKFGL